MHVFASGAAVQFIQEHDGRLYLRLEHHNCCGGSYTILKSSTVLAEEDERFRSIPTDGFELFLSTAIRELPSTLHLLRRGLFKHRIEACWNGCAFVL